MAKTASDINKYRASLELTKLLLEWKCREPTYSAGPLHSHHLLKVSKPFSLAGKPRESWEICIECLLQWGLGEVLDVCPLGLL